MKRRSALTLVAFACGAAAATQSGLAMAQASWPDRPVRIVVPYAAGQGADVLMRLIASELQSTLGLAVVVENRAGAGGNIGTAAVAKSVADGYTFLLGTNATNAANEFLYPSLGFSPSTDFESVAMIGLLPMVIGTTLPGLKTNDLPQLIARARAKPDTLSVGLPSTTAQVVFAQFVRQAPAPLFAVRYKSSGQSMTDALGGQIPLVIDTVTASRAHVASGKLHALAITSLNSSDMLPGVKPVAELGVPGFDVVAWDAIFAPRGTPADVVKKLSEHIERALRKPEMRKRMQDIGVEPLYMGPAQLGEFVKAERVKWGGIIQAANIRTE